MGLSWGNSINSFKKFTIDMSDDMEKDIQKIVDDTGRDIEIDAKRNTPVETGNLKNAWDIKRKGKGEKRSAEIYNPLEYAPIIEYGTKKTAPKRMLEKALIKSEKGLKKRMDALGNKTANKFNRG